MEIVYNKTSTYVALAGILVSVLGHYGFIVEQTELVQVIAGLVTLFGVIKQGIEHKKMAVAAVNAGANVRGI